MAFDGLVMANLAYELKQKLEGGRISKIAMPDKNELIISIKNNSGSFRLLISADASLPLMYLTEQNKPGPLVAPAFCMLLRKHIGSARILSVSQLGLERIIRIELEHLNELGDVCRKRLYIELMGKHSNIIFTDDSDRIIDSIKRISAQLSSLREVLPGREYFLPKELKKSELNGISFEDFKSLILASDRPLDKAIYMSFSGISPLIANELCIRAGAGSETPALGLNEAELIHIYHTCMRMNSDIISAGFVPNIIYRGESPLEFSAFRLESYPESEYRIKIYESISLLLQDFYSAKDAYMRIRQKSSDLRKIVNTSLERAVKKFELQEKQLKDSLKKDRFKVYGDLINTYGYELAGGEKVLKCLNYYDENREISIPLDENLTAAENAKKYYEKYSKLKRTEEALNIEIQKTSESIEHLSSVSTSLDLASDESDLVQIKDELIEYGYIKKHFAGKKLKTVSRPLHFISSDGFHIYVGKNNYQNEEITFKIASGNDWWFHAKGVPGSHVIVKSENQELPDRVYEEAAALAAYYSKNRDNDKVEVDYIQKKNIKKVTGAAPGFVIYHSNWSMIAEPACRVKEANI